MAWILETIAKEWRHMKTLSVPSITWFQQNFSNEWHYVNAEHLFLQMAWIRETIAKE